MFFLPSEVEFLSGLLGFLFTVALLSYLVGDNPVYKIALHIFIGVSIGYATLVVMFQVLVPRLLVPVLSGNTLLMLLSLVPLLLFAALLTKLNPRLALIGNISVAYLLGVGSAVAVGGAVQGTLFPQIGAAWSLAETNIVSGIIAMLITAIVLLSFQFWQFEREKLGQAAIILDAYNIVQAIGKGFLVITLGAIYGSMILSGIAIFGERLVAFSQFAAALVP